MGGLPVSSPKKKVLVLGGTGAMGVYLLPILAEKEYEIYVTSRKKRDSGNRNIKYIMGNAKDDAFLDECLTSHYDVIVDFMAYSTEEFKRRYEKLLSATDHYMFLSSYRVYGDSDKELITEKSVRLLDCVNDPEYLATDEYALAKARQENLLTSSDFRNWTILRPAITYATNRFQLATMEVDDFVYRALNGKDIIFPKEMLDKETTLSWGGDVAKMISRLMLNEKAYGEAFTLATAEHHKWREVVDYYRKILGVHVKIVSLSEYQEVTRSTWRTKYDRMLNRMLDNSKVLSATGMQQSDLMPLYDGLRIELANFSRKPQYGAINHALQKRMDAAVYSKSRETMKKLRRYAGKAKKLLRSPGQLPGKAKKALKKVLKKVKG